MDNAEEPEDMGLLYAQCLKTKSVYLGGETMEFDYEAEKAKLKKKLSMLAVIFVVMVILFNTLIKADSFGWSIIYGIVVSLMMYVPGRIKERFHKGWIFTIIVGIAYMYLYVWLFGVIGNFAILLIILPLADIGYSIYKISSHKKDV